MGLHEIDRAVGLPDDVEPSDEISGSSPLAELARVNMKSWGPIHRVGLLASSVQDDGHAHRLFFAVKLILSRYVGSPYSLLEGTTDQCKQILLLYDM